MDQKCQRWTKAPATAREAAAEEIPSKPSVKAEIRVSQPTGETRGRIPVWLKNSGVFG